MVSLDPKGHHDHKSGDPGPVASSGVSPVLAVEVPLTCRTAAARSRAAGADSADEPGEPLWGAPRIHGELLKLGFEVAQSSVAKYMVKRRDPPSQGWRTFTLPAGSSLPRSSAGYITSTVGSDFRYRQRDCMMN